MEARYNVYFAGEVMTGHAPETVRENLAKVFNADQQTLDKLFSGKAQLIKQHCDKATALKYKNAMERAGAQPIIKAADTAASASDSTRAMTPAEKIAALAAAPVAERYSPADGDKSPNTDSLQKDAIPATGGIGLAPEGTAVLRAEERAQPVSREVDTSGLAVDTAAQRLSEEASPPPAAPDTSHLAMGQPGETIPNLATAEAPLTPNTDALNLAPAGADFSDCSPPAAENLNPDISSLELAPPGTDVLEDEYRNQEHGAAPATDHITLQD